MALNAWICPGTEGSWGDVNNWLLGIIPIDTHKVVFGSYSQADVVAGLNQTGIDLASLWIQPEYGGNIGSLSNPLVIDSLHTTHEGSGLLSIKFDGAGGSTMIDSPNRQLAAILDGTAGNCWVNVKRGVVDVAAGLSEIDELHVSYHNSPGDDAIVNIAPSANSIGQFTMCGGIVTNSRHIVDSTATQQGVLSMGGGQMFFEGSADIDRLNVFGGVFVNNSTGAIIVSTLQGGTVDCNQKPGARTMTSVRIFEGAEFRRSGDVTVTNFYDYRNDAERP